MGNQGKRASKNCPEQQESHRVMQIFFWGRGVVLGFCFLYVFILFHICLSYSSLRVATWRQPFQIDLGSQKFAISFPNSGSAGGISVVNWWSLRQTFRQRCGCLSLEHRCQSRVRTLHESRIDPLAEGVNYSDLRYRDGNKIRVSKEEKEI